MLMEIHTPTKSFTLEIKTSRTPEEEAKNILDQMKTVDGVTIERDDDSIVAIPIKILENSIFVFK